MGVSGPELHSVPWCHSLGGLLCPASVWSAKPCHGRDVRRPGAALHRPAQSLLTAANLPPRGGRDRHPVLELHRQHRLLPPGERIDLVRSDHSYKVTATQGRGREVEDFYWLLDQFWDQAYQKFVEASKAASMETVPSIIMWSSEYLHQHEHVT